MSIVTGVMQRLGAIVELNTGRIDVLLFQALRFPHLGFRKRWHSSSKALEFERALAARKAVSESYSRLPVAR